MKAARCNTCREPSPLCRCLRAEMDQLVATTKMVDCHRHAMIAGARVTYLSGVVDCRACDRTKCSCGALAPDRTSPECKQCGRAFMPPFDQDVAA